MCSNMSLTSIVRHFFVPRWHELERHQNGGEQLQRETLMQLMQQAKDTEYGRNHLFGAVKGYDDFVRDTPVNTYEELKGDIDRMRQGETDVLWPGRVKWYAKSSGTTNDKSKVVPMPWPSTCATTRRAECSTGADSSWVAAMRRTITCLARWWAT